MTNTTITVVHIGLDYGNIEVYDNGKTTEYEVPLGLAKALNKVL